MFELGRCGGGGLRVNIRNNHPPIEPLVINIVENGLSADQTQIADGRGEKPK